MKYLIAFAIVIGLAAGIWQGWEHNACFDRGGVYVRTLTGMACIKAEVVP